MNEYVFYFDETFHTKKITRKNKKLNISNKNVEDFYVGCYVGSADWSKVIKEVEELEKEFKMKLGLSEKQELKSTSLIKTNKIKYGLYSMNDISTDFFNRLLAILDGNVMIHFSILNKHETLLKALLPDPDWFEQRGVQYKPFIYSFTKFLILHEEYNFYDILMSSDRNRMKRRKIVNILQKHLKKIERIKKKDSERMAVVNMINIFDKLPVYFNAIDELSWDYDASIMLFSAFLHEHGILLKHLYIDDEEKTLRASKKKFNNNTSALKSTDSIQIRICDWIAGLVSRMIFSYNRDYMQISTIDDLSEKIHILDDNFFNFPLQKEILLKKMIDVFLNQQEGHWGTAGSIYNDGATEFYTLLSYCKYCFENGVKPNPQEYNLHLSMCQQKEFESMY